MPRSNRRSSKFRRLRGKRTYIRTMSRITSGDELNPLNGLGGLARDLRGIGAIYQGEGTPATQL